MAAAKSLVIGLSEREASHIAFFDLLVAGESEAALSALGPHLEGVHKWLDRQFRPRRPETHTPQSAGQACPELR
jgi:hypothetical protein